VLVHGVRGAGHRVRAVDRGRKQARCGFILKEFNQSGSKLRSSYAEKKTVMKTVSDSKLLSPNLSFLVVEIISLQIILVIS